MNTLFEHLKHIRSIHFVLVLISFTLISFIVPVWSDAPEIVKELESLIAITKKLSTNSIEHDTLVKGDLRIPHFNETLDSIEVAFDQKLIVEKELRHELANQSFHLFPLDGSKDLITTSMTLRELREAIEGKEWGIHKLSQIYVKQEVRNNATKWTEENTKIEVGAGATVWGGEGPYLIGLEIEWDDDDVGEDNKARHSFILRIKRFSSSTDMQTGMTFISHLTPVDIKVPFSFKRITERGIKMPEIWFEQRYPHLTGKSNWDLLKNQSATANIDTAREKIMNSLEGKDIDLPLIGAKIYGQDIGYIGPVVIFLILMYMLAHASYICSSFSTHVTNNSEREYFFLCPWIGAMPGILRRIFTWIMLAFLPGLAVWLAIWRVSTMYSLALFVAIMVGLFGSYCTYLGWCISRIISRLCVNTTR